MKQLIISLWVGGGYSGIYDFSHLNEVRLYFSWIVIIEICNSLVLYPHDTNTLEFSKQYN